MSRASRMMMRLQYKPSYLPSLSKDFTNDKMSASKATTGVVTPSKTPANAQVGDAVLSPQGGKPSGRRKKQSHKAKPPHLQTEGETSALEYKVGGGELSAISGSLSARLTDGVEKSNQGDQQSPLAMSPLPSAIEANGSNAGLIDFQAQLEQVRLASDASKKQLQVQLEELRSRKRDEDAARLDVKGRMKILDESKRHAEGSKREAERRLKVANGLRESIENKIEGKMQEMEDWKAKKATNEVKIQQSGEKKTMRIAELRVEIRKKEEESHEAEEDLEHLKARLETLQQRMLEEEANLEAARELAVERDIAALANRSYVNPSDHSFQFHNTYPLLSGPGDLGDHSMGDMSTDASQYTGWDAHNRGYQSYGGLSQGLNHPIALISDDIKEDLDETFDPTIAPSPLVETHSTFAPFSFDRSAFQSSMIIPSTEQTSSIVPMFSEGSSIPITPFTSDLLPSNLFQNADDDERHVGVLPGTRSEQVEAALNRFGLDTSDTSDVEGSGEGVDNLLGNGDLQGNINEKEDNEEEEEGGEEKDLSRSNSNLRTAARSWWNARSRNASKDRSTSSSIAALSSVDNANTPDAVIEAVPQREAAKRRSISIFPKLSLNPGAKSFRGPSKKADNGIQFADHDDLAAQSSWSSATGQIPTRQDFESMKRAFQSNLLGAGQQDEEEGRKSWSAFDTWQQQQQFQQRNGSFTAVNTGNRPMTNFPSHINNAMYQNQRASSESLAQIRRLPSSSTSPQGTNWLDDVFLPLHKSQSIDDTNSSASSTSINRSSNRVGKPSRFSFWSSNGSSNHNSGPPANPSSPSITATSEGGSVSLDSAPALQQQLSSHSGTPQPSKRTSFRWSRRQESSSTDVQALSEKIKDQD